MWRLLKHTDPDVSRRSPKPCSAWPTLVTAAVFSLVASSCGDAIDTTTVARVGDEVLDNAGLATYATELGIPDDLELDATLTRQIISEWINTTAVESGLVDLDAVNGFDTEQIAARFDAGIEESGIACPQLIVTDNADNAGAAIDELRAGTSFADVFEEFNLDPGLAQSTGLIQCVPYEALIQDAGSPNTNALLPRTATDRYGIAVNSDPLDESVQAALVVDFRPFDELDDVSAEQVDATVRSVLATEALDVTVDSRYGYFDAVSGSVVPLR